MKGDSVENRVKFKIGEIEFEAEGSADTVERERSIFLNTILPAAVDAIVRTRGSEKATQYIEAVEQPAALLPSEEYTKSESNVPVIPTLSDLSRTSLAAFLKSYGKLSEQDFALISAYYYEKKNNENPSFSSDSVKKYYAEARRTEPSNVSMVLNQLVQKGLIMDDPNAEQKTPKQYILTDDGIKYIEAYTPKEDSGEKKSTKIRRTRVKTKSTYSEINVDELNLSKYCEIKSLKDFKEKMMMILFVVTNEKKGEWFTSSDVLYLMMDIFGEPATRGQVNGVFKREKLWFKTENVEGNKKEMRRKLLNNGLEYAKALITAT